MAFDFATGAAGFVAAAAILGGLGIDPFGTTTEVSDGRDSTSINLASSTKLSANVL